MVIQCEICNKVFNNSPKGYKAEYYLAEHKKNCFRLLKKKQRKWLKEYSQNATDLEINRAYIMLQNPEKYFNENIKRIEKEIKKQISTSDSDSETDEDNNCIYEKEYLHDSPSEVSDDEYIEELDRPSTPDLKEWRDNTIDYLIDDKENVYIKFNKEHIGKRYLSPNGEYKIKFV